MGNKSGDAVLYFDLIVCFLGGFNVRVEFFTRSHLSIMEKHFETV